MLGNMTKEQRAENLEKARKAREEKQKAGENLKQDWLDEPHWRALASKYSVRLPASYIPNKEVKYLKRVAAKLEIDIKEYLESCGCTTIKKLVGLNPDWPAYAEVSMMLEWFDEKMKDRQK